MYVRPAHNKGEMKIPENYSGSMFSRQIHHSDMPPPVRTQLPRYDIPHVDIPPEEEISEDIPTYRIDGEAELSDKENGEKNGKKEVQDAPGVGTSIFSSLLPRGNLSSHFPFGHGIGSEELLILAVMLMVFLSGNECGEVDSEFLLLLGLLLFAG